MNKSDKLLLKHKIAPGNYGYIYMKWILENFKSDIARVKIVPLYEEVAVAFTTTGSRVERAIRHSIESSDLHHIVNKQVLALLQIEYNALPEENEITEEKSSVEGFATNFRNNLKYSKYRLSIEEIALKLTELNINTDATILNRLGIVGVYNEILKELKDEQS